jgi:hypothetical protein
MTVVPGQTDTTTLALERQLTMGREWITGSRP